MVVVLVGHTVADGQEHELALRTCAPTSLLSQVEPLCCAGTLTISSCNLQFQISWTFLPKIDVRCFAPVLPSQISEKNGM